MRTDAGIPRLGPDGDAGMVTRAVRSASQLAPVRRVGAATVRRTDRLVHALTRGPLAPLLVLPFASMTTTGARSGRARETVVLYFNDGPDVILIASNWGADRHPAWYHNLRANPAAVLTRGGRSGTYSAVEVNDPSECDRLFALADRIYAGYTDYRARAAQIGRRIPIMRLQLVD